jgi:OmpR-family two-component system manganese-sensing sensor histidine kinase
MLGRRLFAAYLGAFALVIAVFAVGVELSFISIIREQAVDRLETLARAGAAAVFFTDTGFVVDQRSLGGFDVDSSVEGLEWFTVSKKLVAQRGREPSGDVRPQLGRYVLPGDAGKKLETYTMLLRGPKGHERGYVRASLTADEFNAGVGALDLGIIFGSVVAIVVATLGGWFLARAAIDRTEQSYRRLQEFTADASHELRSPLTALSATAVVALHEAPELGEKTRKRLASIVDTAKDMQRLVDDLLILARAGRSMEREMFAVRIDGILRDVYERYQPLAARKTVDFSVDPGRPGQIIGNPEQVTRIVANLVENAIRYTPTGGSVRLSSAQDNTGVQITVADTGIGIAPEHMERIFNRFWRAGNVREFDGGSGLGLAIARALAERHGGRITVASGTSSGSVFTVTLPQRPSNVG